MLITRYKIMVISPELKAGLERLPNPQPTSWIIAANSMESAWRKFCTQRFGLLLPDPADFDISLHSVTSH